MCWTCHSFSWDLLWKGCGNHSASWFILITGCLFYLNTELSYVPECLGVGLNDIGSLSITNMLMFPQIDCRCVYVSFHLIAECMKSLMLTRIVTADFRMQTQCFSICLDSLVKLRILLHAYHMIFLWTQLKPLFDSYEAPVHTPLSMQEWWANTAPCRLFESNRCGEGGEGLLLRLWSATIGSISAAAEASRRLCECRDGCVGLMAFSRTTKEILQSSNKRVMTHT